MNASRLLLVISELSQTEKKFGIQNALKQVHTNLHNLVQAPQQTDKQAEFSKSINELKVKISSLNSSLSNSQLELIEEVNGSDYFSTLIYDKISQSVRDNPITPSVALDQLSEIINKRESYIENLKKLVQGLRIVGIEEVSLEDGQAEIGFLIPRDMFDNNFNSLINKLGLLDKVIGTFSEVVTGNREDVEVRQISTSDPILFLGMRPEVIAMVGASITWALHVWKKVEEIKKIRKETKHLEVFEDKELAMFDQKIKEIVDQQIKEKIKNLVSEASELKSGRTTPEVKTHLDFALTTLLALVERGMKVEVRYIPLKSEVEGDVEIKEDVFDFSKLHDLQQDLIFPTRSGNPILSLPDSTPDQKATKRTKKDGIEK